MGSVGFKMKCTQHCCGQSHLRTSMVGLRPPHKGIRTFKGYSSCLCVHACMWTCTCGYTRMYRYRPEVDIRHQIPSRAALHLVCVCVCVKQGLSLYLEASSSASRLHGFFSVSTLLGLSHGCWGSELMSSSAVSTLWSHLPNATKSSVLVS